MKQNSEIEIKRLLPKDSKVAKGIFLRCNPKSNYFNFSKLCEILKITEKNGINNSIGLFYKGKLVGFIISFKEIPCSVLPLFLNKSILPKFKQKENSLFLVNMSVDKKYRFLSPTLIYRFSWLVNNNPELKFLELHCLCNYKWTINVFRRKKLLYKLGLKFNWSVNLVEDGNVCLNLVALGRYENTRYEMTDLEKGLRNRHSVTQNGYLFTIGTIQTYRNWTCLEKYWDELLESTPDAHVFQEYAFLRIWWLHLGWTGQLYIVIVLRDGIPVAIAPLQIIIKKWLGKNFRVLTYIGLNMEMDRLTILFDQKSEFAIDKIIEYIKGRQQDWDLITFFEQNKDSVFVEKLKSQFTGRYFWFSCLPGPECARVDLEQSWEDYLEKKSRNFRKSVRQKEGAIKKAGNVTFEYGLSDHRTDGIEKYCSVENQSWKASAGLGLGKSASHRSFYQDLMRNYMAKDSANFAFLYLDDLPISASFGVSRNNTFYSLHICHDERFSSFSPGFVLTALELKKVFNDKRYFIFDFLGGYLSNKSCFATQVGKTESVFIDRKNFFGSFFHFFYYKLKPFLKKMLNKYGLLHLCIGWRNSIKKRL